MTVTLDENMRMHMIHTHGRRLEQLAGRSHEDLKAEHDGLQCPPEVAPDGT